MSESGDMRPFPALLMSISRPPACAVTAVTQDWMDASDSTSSVSRVMLACSSSCYILAALRAVATTCHFCELANSSAKADPSPPSEQPVISTLFRSATFGAAMLHLPKHGRHVRAFLGH